MFYLKSFYFQQVLRREDVSLMPKDSLPGQKSIRLAKKGGGSSFPDAGFSRFSLVFPRPPLFFAERKKGELAKFLPALFDFGACFLARATRRAVKTTNYFGEEPNFFKARV
jgi:hypothetical protein